NKAIERLRRIRGVDERHHLTLMCRDLSEIGAYAIVDDARFRLIKRVTPGSYTFILRATRSLPRRLLHPKRKTIGVRVPAQAIAQTFALYALPVLLGITLHKAAHGYVARQFGDMTAHAQGRISLNPVRHIDVLGTVVVPLIILVASAGKLLFGWAKPVPVNYSALRKPRPHMAWVAAAAPLATPAMALAWALLLRSSIGLSRRPDAWLEITQLGGTTGLIDAV